MNVKAGKIFVAVAAFLMITAIGVKGACAVETSAGGSVDLLSTYVWRGINLGGNEGVVQPSATINYGKFSFNIWSNYDNQFGEVTETDYTVGYSRALAEKVKFEAGYIYYGLDEQGSDIDTEEFYAGLGLALPLNPVARFYYDINKGDGGFATLAISHTLALFPKADLTLGANAGYNFRNKVLCFDNDLDGRVDKFSGLYNGEVNAAIAYKLTDKVTVTPKVAYSIPLSNKAGKAIRGWSYDRDNHVVYGGISITVAP